MFSFILLQHLFYYIAYETTSLVANQSTARGHVLTRRLAKQTNAERCFHNQ